MMNATVFYRIASVLLILFAAGHTFGFLSFKPPSLEALAVRDSMNSVHFQVRGSSFSYGGIYNGFGLYVTAYLRFSPLLASQLGAFDRSNPPASVALGCAFFAVQAASLG